MENLARGDLSRPVIEQIKDAAIGVALEIGKTPANSWSEFHRKLAVLLDDYIDATDSLMSSARTLPGWRA